MSTTRSTGHQQEVDAIAAKEVCLGDLIPVTDNVTIVVVKQLGQGSFGTTWMVVAQNYAGLGEREEPVMALKVPKAAVTVEEALFEAELMSQMMVITRGDCPTVRLIRSFLYEGKLALLMPLMQGDLRNFTQGPLSASETFGLGRKLLGLLRNLHAAGIVHLDLKLDNILVGYRFPRFKLVAALRAVHTALADEAVTGTNRTQLADVEHQLRAAGATLRKMPRHQLDSLDIKLGDVGLSCKITEIPRYPGGTPGYMAPEATLGGVNTHKLDMFGFGVLLAEVATGESLFTIVGRTDGEKELNVLNQMADVMGPFTSTVINAAASRRTYFKSNARTATCPTLPSLRNWVAQKLLIQLEWSQVDCDLLRTILSRSLALNSNSRSNTLCLSMLF